MMMICWWWYDDDDDDDDDVDDGDDDDYNVDNDMVTVTRVSIERKGISPFIKYNDCQLCCHLLTDESKTGKGVSKKKEQKKEQKKNKRKKNKKRAKGKKENIGE